MTVYEDEIPARRRGVGAKVLGLACAILAILGSFWGIVWFIRSYVEPPRVMLPATAKLASTGSIAAPVPAPTPTIAADSRVEEAKPILETQAGPPPVISAPAAAPMAAPSAPIAKPAAAAPNDSERPAGSVADRWGSVNQFAPAATSSAPAAPALAAAAPAAPPPPAASAPDPAESAPAALATGNTETAVEEVAEGSVPAIEGPAPLPRRRPVMTAQRHSDPPLPRPRPDGQVAPQSVFIAVPTTDDRYPSQQ